MAVSSRLRFEILKRDNFTCRYCGRRSAGTELRVDHVVPRTLGGSDLPDNLVAACHDCNAGKSSTFVDLAAADIATPPNQVMRDAIAYAAKEKHPELPETEAACAALLERWHDWACGKGDDRRPIPMDDGWRSTVRIWVVRGLPLDVMLDAVQIAMTREKVAVSDVWRYFCGICWNRLTQLENRAKELIAEATFSGYEESCRDSIEDSEWGA